MYMVYHQDVDYTSRPQLPVAVFNTEDDAIAWASAQPGYGYNTDWFVKPIVQNPPMPEHKTMLKANFINQYGGNFSITEKELEKDSTFDGMTDYISYCLKAGSTLLGMEVIDR